MAYRIIIDPKQKHGKIVKLTFDQKHYLKNVLRLKNKSPIIILDGFNNNYLAQLAEDNAVIIRVLNENTELSINVTLIVAMPKENQFNNIIRSCTELGISTILPVFSQRTLLRPSESKLKRWRRIAEEATEQSERQIIPEILTPISFSKALINIMEQKVKNKYYICVARQNVKHMLSYLSRLSATSIVIATGCEGGWTDKEISQAIKVGFIPVTLGSRILRAATAPIVAMSLISSVTEQYNYHN